MANRQCGTCTKCCEGYLSGEALGHKFYPGKPCHFIAIGKGCSIYAKRPTDPCASYKCGWLTDVSLPEWMKPDEINAIIDTREINEIPYILLREAGGIMDVRVLSWMIVYVLQNNLNLKWMVDGGFNYLGSPEFLKAMDES